MDMLKRRFGALVLVATSIVLALAACTTPVTKPKAFAFVNALEVEPGASVTSNEVVITGITAPSPIKVTGDGLLVIDGKEVAKPGSVLNNTKLRVKLTASAVFGETVMTTVDVGGQKATFSVTTRSADTQVDAVDFESMTNAEPGATVTSKAVTISGIETPVSIAVAGGGDPILLINGEAATESPTVQNGDNVRVSLTASNDFEGTVTATVTIGGAGFDFTVTTRPAHANPDGFSFPPVTGAEPGATVHSDPVTVTGIETPVPVTVSGAGDPELLINGEAATENPTVQDGDTLQVSVTASNDFEGTVSAIVEVGGQSAAFTVTTRAADVQADPVSFTPAMNAQPGTVVTSDAITIGGIEVPVVIELSGDATAQLIVNGAPVASPGTVNNGDTVRVSLSASNDFEGVASATVDVGGQSASFSVTTRAFAPPVINLTTTPSNPSPAVPGAIVTLSWTVSGDYDTLVLSNDRTAGTQDVIGMSTTQVTIPSAYPSIQYTLTARHAQRPGSPANATSSIAVPLWVCQDPSDTITFEDADLEAVVRTAAGLTPTGPITCANVQGVTALNTNHHVDDPGHISSLIGLQHLRSLQSLRAPYNDVVSLAPLAGLTDLRDIHLDKNMVTDLSPLSGLTQLQYISFWDSGPNRQTDDTADDPATCRDGISDLTPLTALVSITEIYMSCNNIASLQPLAGLADLEVLYLISNQVADISPLSGKTHLQALRLSDNLLTGDNAVFGSLTALRWLQVAYNSLTDASLNGLAGLTDLYSLDAEGNYFTSFAPLTGNAAFPGAERFGRDDMEPMVPTVSLAYNCIADVDAVTTAFTPKGVTVIGTQASQRTDCAEGFARFGGASDRSELMLQQFRLRQAQPR